MYEGESRTASEDSLPHEDGRLKDGRLVLCGASAYTEMYYLNPVFERLPEDVKEELRTIAILFTQDAGGAFYLVFEEDGELSILTDADEEDITYDEITAGLLAGKLRRERSELLHGLELYYGYLTETM